MHVVNHVCAFIARHKPVLVSPKPIGSSQLFIHKAARRFLVGDLALPPQREPVHAQTNINNGSLMQERGGRDNGKIHPVWRQNPQVTRIGKEREDFLSGTGQPLFCVKRPECHDSYEALSCQEPISRLTFSADP